jgi:hypothetical protein
MTNSTAMVSGIAVAGGFAFVGSTDVTGEFRVLDVRNPAQIVSNGCGPYNYAAKASAVKYVDGVVVVSNLANDALRVIYDTPGTTCN